MSSVRRSTVGQVAFLGNHVVKHACSLLQVIGLSSAEHEYCAIGLPSAEHEHYAMGLSSAEHEYYAISVATIRIASDSSAASRSTS